MSTPARILDLNSDHPLATDRILVDSQILIWLFWAGSSKPTTGVHLNYQRHLKRALEGGAELWHCPLQLAEVAHVIEKQLCKLEAYTREDYRDPVDIKEYRPIVREKLRKSVAQSWASIKEACPGCANISLASADADAAILRLSDEHMDAYDLFLLVAARQNKLTHIVTADRDYLTAREINVITADAEMLDCAKREKRLASGRTLAHQTRVKREMEAVKD